MALTWELLTNAGTHLFLDEGANDYAMITRAPVPGGWLVRYEVRCPEAGMGLSITFMPDPNHEWTGDSVPL